MSFGHREVDENDPRNILRAAREHLGSLTTTSVGAVASLTDMQMTALEQFATLMETRAAELKAGRATLPKAVAREPDLLQAFHAWGEQPEDMRQPPRDFVDLESMFVHMLEINASLFRGSIETGRASVTLVTKWQVLLATLPFDLLIPSSKE